jgi:hypothetical protein
MSERPNPMEGVSLTGTPEKPTPQQSKYLALVRDLTDSAAIQVVKVATCKCDKRETCKIYLQARKMADIIDQLQEIREGRTIGQATERPEGRRKGGKRRGNV